MTRGIISFSVPATDNTVPAVVNRKKVLWLSKGDIILYIYLHVQLYILCIGVGHGCDTRLQE
jgi:hypothetical protein